MAQERSSGISAVGIAWYRREDWPRIRAIMADADKLPATYEKWLYAAEKTLKQIERGGVAAHKVHIDPESFPAWCRARGLNVDAKARMEFANLHAIGMQRQKN